MFALTNAWYYASRPLFVARFHRHLGIWPDLARPRRLSELVQWRKLMDRNPTFVVFADKLATKAWIAERLPGLSGPQTLWVGERPGDIPDAMLTPGHVIKTNNASGQNYLPHRQTLTRPEVDRKFQAWLRASKNKRRLGWLDQGQEWPYGKVDAKIFVERQVAASGELVDISVRVFDGEVLFVSCALDYKAEGSRLGYFRPDGTPLNDPENYKLPPGFIVPPAFFEAVRAASRLGRGFDYLRIDFLADDDRLCSGEITCYPASGLSTDDWFIQIMYRRWLDTLPSSWVLSTPQPWPRRLYLAAFRRWLDRRRAELARQPEPREPGT